MLILNDVEQGTSLITPSVSHYSNDLHRDCFIFHLWINGTQELTCTSGYCCNASLYTDIECHQVSSTDTKILSI